MGILRRLRARGAGFIAQRLSGKALALSASLPLRRSPLCEIRVEAASEPQADGERIRLRAHVHLKVPGRGDINSWVEVRASNAALDDGSRALLPDRLEALGIQPQADRPVQTWAGALRGGKPGLAVLSLLRFDKTMLPAALQRLLGDRPFQLSAAAASVVEED